MEGTFKGASLETFYIIFAKSDGDVRILFHIISYKMALLYQGGKAITYQDNCRSTSPEMSCEKRLTCTEVMMYP